MEELRSILLHTHPDPRQISIDDKKKIILKTLELTAYEPEQGSKAWAEGRQIGGSDASSMMGKGYRGKDAYDVIRDKIFPSSFQGSIHTRFGKTFEEVGRLIIEKIFQHEVWELKSLPNKLPFTTYSPDGVTIVQLAGKLLMILLEFKMPMNRIPCGKIYPEYLPQVKAGLCAMPFLDAAIFVNTMLRTCLLKDLCYNFNYNLSLHESDLKVPKSPKNSSSPRDSLYEVLGFGLVVLYRDDINRSNLKEHSSINDESEFSNYKEVEKNGKTFYVYDDGTDVETDLYKSKPFDIIKTISERHRNKDKLYSYISKKYPDMPLQGFNYVEPDDKTNEIELFRNALLNPHETDFGGETLASSDEIFKAIEEKKFVRIKHIAPYLVFDHIATKDLINQCGIKSNNTSLIHPDSQTADYITNDARIYLIDELTDLRTEFEKSGDEIIGVIPYKIFKIDFIYQDNNEPNFMDKIKESVEIYGKIKIECKEIDELDIDVNEKRKKKEEVLFKYFPHKKDAQLQKELDNTQAGLEKILLNDDSMF